MKIRTLLLIFFSGLFFISSAFPQEDEDSTKVWPEHEKHKNFKFHFCYDEFKGDPTFSINYGFSNIKLKDLHAVPSKPNLLEIKLGYSKENAQLENENIIKYNYRFLSVLNFSTDLAGKKENAILPSDMWRIGLGRDFGYGYKIGDASVIPYHSYSLEWSKAKFNNLQADSADLKLLSPFNDTFRFGTSMEGGIRIKLFSHFIVEGAYQRSIIFPRHLFWKWAGSAIIEIAGQTAIDNFVNEIMDSSPYAAPVMSFLLKNALSYGMYELRQSKMNWPFKTAAPLSYDQFKIGLTLAF